MSRTKLLLLSIVITVIFNFLGSLIFGIRYLTSIELILMSFIGAWCGDKSTERKV